MQKVKEWKTEKEMKEFEELEQTRRARVINAMQNATRRFRWSYKPLVESTFCTQNDWNCTLLTKINEANKDFNGNTLIASCEANAILEDLVFYNINTNETNNSVNSTFYKTAMLGSFHVFVDAYLPAPVLLIVKDDFFTSENSECVVIMIDNLPSFGNTGPTK